MEKEFTLEEKKYIFSFIRKEELSHISEEAILWQLELLLYNYLKQNDRELTQDEKQHQFIDNLYLKILVHHKQSGEYSEVILREMADIKKGILQRGFFNCETNTE